MYASMFSFIIGTILIALYVFTTGQTVAWEGVRAAPWYAWLGGLFGAYCLTAIILAFPMASKVNALGEFDAVIHNAGVYNASAEEIFTVNTLAPYILTCLIQRPKRLIYLSSDMHSQGRSKLESFETETGRITYSDSKLHVLMLCMAVARKWPQVYANALDPGWVATKMGGQGAPDDLHKGYETQVWLAVSNDEKAKVSGRYFYHRKESRHNPEADDALLQERFLSLCQEMTGASFP
jgi:NAD(P)-dependent dehydrogenase (short-subunit alcohol dehydrogenase family)